MDGKVRLTVTAPPGASRELTADHVIAATGYRIDLTRLGFLPDAIRSSLRTVGGSAVVGATTSPRFPGFTSSGPSVAPTMGPVMRFVFGAEHAAPGGRPASWRVPPAEGLTCCRSEPVMDGSHEQALAKPRAGPGAAGDRLGLGARADDPDVPRRGGRAPRTRTSCA